MIVKESQNANVRVKNTRNNLKRFTERKKKDER